MRFARSERRTLTQGFVALFISSGGDLLAGLALSFMDHQLRTLPGLIILIPAAIGMRGNIFGALGSRLGTGIHAGQFEPTCDRNGFLGQNALGDAGTSRSPPACSSGPRRTWSRPRSPATPLSVADFITISILGGMLGLGRGRSRFGGHRAAGRIVAAGTWTRSRHPS